MLLNMSTFVERFYFELSWQIMENNVEYNHPKWKKSSDDYDFLFHIILFYILYNQKSKKFPLQLYINF